MSSFDSFTNLYSLSKTLRFELKPMGQTQKMLEENKVFEVDVRRKESYDNIKPYLDRLHRDFINESLSPAYLEGLPEYFQTFSQFKANKKDKNLQKNIDTQRKALREQVVSFFDAKGKQWATEQYVHLNIKKKDLNILFEQQIFQILKDRYGAEKETQLVDEKIGEAASIFDGWKGFTGYFTKFFETRKNFYKSDGTSTALATRVINQNLDRFLDNLTTWQSIKDKIDGIEVERFFGLKTDEVFSVDFYNKCLLQKGINTYNDFLGGKILDSGEKQKGVNELINKYRQDNKGEKLPFLKKLDKQIHSEKEKFIEEIETPEKFQEVLRNFYDSAQAKVSLIRALLADFFNNTDRYDIAGVYLSKEAFNTISHKWTNEIDSFNESLYIRLKGEKIISSSAKKKDGGYSFPDFISMAHIKASLESIPIGTRFWKERYYEGKKPTLDGTGTTWNQFLKIFHFEFFSHFERIIIDTKTGEQQTIGYDVFAKDIETLFEDFKINSGSKVIIKNFADESLYIYQMAKYFALEKKRAWVTQYDDSLDIFYTDPDNGYLKFYDNAYEEIVQTYNKIRNYLTKKPYSEAKWKLNFECSYLLSGWSGDFNTYSSLLIEKDERYYLAIVNGTLLDKETRQRLLQNITSENKAQKLVYDFQKPDNKNVPRLFIRSKGDNFAPAVDDLGLPVQSILEIYDNGFFKTENRNNPNFKPSLVKLIDYFKNGFSKHGSYKHFDFKWKSSTEYKDISEFYEDTIRSCYMLDWENINFDELLNLTAENKLYFFQIYNKDFSEQTKGMPSLHSLYFKSLFLKENLKNRDGAIFKLSGGGEIFYRPKTSKDKLGYREDKQGKKVIMGRRYAEDKMFLHFPIELNYARNRRGSLNNIVNDFLANNPDINIIGVDRGEKHLAYYSVINQKGEILLDENDKTISGSLNLVGEDSEGKPIDYHKKLSERAEKREQARRDWQSIEGIKDLKKGYISQVVRKLADLAIKHNAIIVIEDLNIRFKQIRGGIEKSAYQQLEKALIEKLNFLVNKGEVDPTKAGHLLSAYQLTAPFETFKDMGKQTGIIFYTQAAYTSRIDPLTGWRPNLYLKYSNADQSKKDILKLDNVSFNKAQDRFEFTYDIEKFFNAKEFPNKTTWTICSNVERFRWDKKRNNNKGGYVPYPNVTENLKELFEAHGIDHTVNILQQVSKLETKSNGKFFEDLIFYIRLICQIRNTQPDKDGNKNDFVLSPVEPFFDSREAGDFGNNLPQNGDDNGAYNIARKGILILSKISDFYNTNGTTEKLSWNDVYISHVDWDNFAAKQSK
ncbi:MAG: type V CRISPR-associated protein Cas12a/Cpf1 [Candidatus Roizmanbacteria bacterium]|nr:type V CRISPR-associated protein Cas12a/Cpf1 [Candidatus Roizmanbacteria bacterium]